MGHVTKRQCPAIRMVNRQRCCMPGDHDLRLFRGHFCWRCDACEAKRLTELFSGSVGIKATVKVHSGKRPTLGSEHPVKTEEYSRWHLCGRDSLSRGKEAEQLSQSRPFSPPLLFFPTRLQYFHGIRLLWEQTENKIQNKLGENNDG